VRLDCLSHLALLHAVRGRLSLAVRTAEAAGAHAGASPAVSGALLALAWVHYQRDDLATATGYLERAAEAAGAAPAWPLGVATMVMRGRLWSAQADPARASAELAAARQALAGRHQPRLLVDWLAATDAEIKLAAGHVEAARAVLEEPGTPEPAAAPEVVTVARLQLAAGDPAGAIGSLTPLLDGATPAPDLDARIRAWLLHASASHDLDLPDQAAASLGRAVDLAAPEDHRRIFLDAGAPGRALLVSYRDWLDASWPFLDELAQASLDPAPAAVSPMPALVEPLSERERVVLRYLPTMLTFVEIGSELFISVNTTKSHVRNIYRKLGVVGRRDAVRRARQLQLLRS
jgi:LuxR family transcriptional regulator, maltose regulon positive regulatory protein